MLLSLTLSFAFDDGLFSLIAAVTCGNNMSEEKMK